MSDDRTLLERAARAAGITLRPFIIKPADPNGGDGFVGYMTDPREWLRGWFDPLADDGDALRLAVMLRIRIGGMGQRAVAFAGALECWEDEGSDPYAATRRAITRAAAALAGEDGNV